MNIPVIEYLKNMAREESNSERAKIISDAQTLFGIAIEKLEELGHNIVPIVNVSSKVGDIGNSSDHKSLSYTEAIRLLIIADYMKKNNESPNLIDLANYKADHPTRDDAANEGRIVNLLESKELVIKNRTAGKKMDKERLSLSEAGVKIAESITDDAQYLRKVYNRSRNPRLREFILLHLDSIQAGQKIQYK